MSPLLGLYRLLLHQQMTRGRLVLTGALSGLALLVTVLIARNALPSERIESTVGFLSVFGLALMVPILSLVLASSSLGQLVEDQTLVYLWLRPNPRWMLALAAWLASATVAVPVSVVPLVVASAIGTGGDGRTMGAVAAAMGLAAVAYTGLFTLVGLLIRRSLIWGLAYLFIWELFVARVGQGAARLSINTYPASVLSHITHIELPQADRGFAYAVVIPLLAAALSVVLTAWRLSRADVA